MIVTIVRFIVYLICMLLTCSCYNTIENKKLNANSTVQATRILSDQKWNEDFEELYTLLKTYHRNLYHKTGSETFETLASEIRNDIPKLSDQEIIVTFASFVALVNDGHTRLTLPLQKGLGLNQAHSKTPYPSNKNLVFRHLPIEFYWFDDGLFITKATKEYRNLIGKEVLLINDMPAMEVLKKVRSVSHFDNENGFKLIAASRLSVLEVLHALKIVDSNNSKVTMLLHSNGIDEEVKVSVLERFTKESFVMSQANHEITVPLLSRQKNNEYYWYRYFAKEKVIYLQLNQINNAKNGPSLVQFLGDLNAFVQTVEVERLILDLRNNFGGNNYLTVPVVNLILQNDNLNKIGNFYTLIGRKTFSAAQSLVNDLRKWTNVIFVGESTGASPNSYGDSKKVVLSNSNLTVRIATIYWRDFTTEEHNPWITPDIPVENNALDYFQNKDQGLKLCLNFKRSKNWIDTYYRLYTMGGMATIERLYTRFGFDWERSPEEFKTLEHMITERIVATN